jgi:small subunit ribosomal protein S9
MSETETETETGTGTPVIPVPAAPEAVTPTEPSLASELSIGSQSGIESAAPAPRPIVLHGFLDAKGTAVATGRRKTAVARVRLKRGSGKYIVNDREMTEFFPVERDQILVQAPLKLVGMTQSVDVWVRVSGGGISGQAGAILLGIARALAVFNPDLHHQLSENGYLTRDDRMVERKKYGHKKARRSFQFSKR